jgi:hypothetical protein
VKVPSKGHLSPLRYLDFLPRLLRDPHFCCKHDLDWDYKISRSSTILFYIQNKRTILNILEALKAVLPIHLLDRMNSTINS